MKTVLSTLFLAVFVSLCSCHEDSHQADDPLLEAEVCDPTSPLGCSWSLQSEEDLSRYRNAVDVIDRELDAEAANLPPSDPRYQKMMAQLIERVGELEGIESVTSDGRWLTFKVLPGGYTHDVIIGMDAPLSRATGKLLEKAPEDLDARIAHMFDAVSLRRQALVTETATPLPNQKKRARFFAPWNWYFDELADTQSEFARFRGELTMRRDYQAPGGVETYLRANPWVPDDENLREGLVPFTGWNGIDFINIVTHGKNAPLRLSTGIVIGSARGGESKNLVGITCEELWRSQVPRGIRCTRRIEVPIDGEEDDFTLHILVIDQRFLEQHGSNLSTTRSIVILEACSTLKDVTRDPRLLDFIGQDSVVYGGDELVAATSDATFKFQLALVTLGLPTHIAYAIMEEADHTSYFGGGIYRLFPEMGGLRAAEVISLHAPDEEHYIRDGDTLPVELDDDGNPRLLKIDARYFGVLTEDIDKTLFGAPQRFEAQNDPSMWLTRVEEMNGPGEEATSKGSVLGEARPLFTDPAPTNTGPTEYKKKLILKFDRDLDTTDPVYLRATVELPEGGESIHTVRVIPLPLDSLWSMDGSAHAPDRAVRGQFVEGYHHEALKRLSVYLRDDSDAFIDQDGEYFVDLTLRGFDGQLGAYPKEDEPHNGVIIDIRYTGLDVHCVSAMGRVMLDEYIDEDRFRGSFRTGEDTLCYIQGGSAMESAPLSGRFLLDKSQ